MSIGCVLAVAGSLLLTGVRGTGGYPVGCWPVSRHSSGGAGLVTTSVVAAVVRATPPDRAGLATGVSNTARQTGTATGVAIFGAVAGSPHDPHFVPAFHMLALAAAVAWCAALAITRFGVVADPRWTRPAA
ncbi:hypothetical protein [Nocardia sp. NPDC051570]|uniref:hypothetical protein n=1 Tax=Nocardia sp. NPDC051570 TaxID=3364324 RepID=UPI003792165A